MAQLEQILSCIPAYSENILPISAMFEGEVTINQSGDGTISQSTTKSYEGTKSINYNCNTTGLPIAFNEFNFGDDLKATAVRTGSHILSFRIQNNTAYGDEFELKFKVYLYINGLLSETYDNTNVMEVANIGKWVTFAQSFDLIAGDTFNLTFEFAIPVPVAEPTFSINLDGFKLEFDDKNIGLPSVYSLPEIAKSKRSDLMVAETQWDVPDIGPQVIANGASLNLLTLINNVSNKNLSNSDDYDQLDIVSNSIKTTFRGAKIIHLIRISLNILSGVEQYYQIQIRRTVDNSVVYRCMMQRNPDETIQTIEMTTRTLSDIDPFVVDGFYIAFVNNSGASATIDDSLSLLVISTYQNAQNT